MMNRPAFNQLTNMALSFRPTRIIIFRMLNQ